MGTFSVSSHSEKREDWYPVAINHIADVTGTLSVMEEGTSIPFDVKRVFWVGQVPDAQTTRGSHAHLELQQVIFCVTGSCDIALESRNGFKQSVTLEANGDGLYVNGPVWRDMSHFTPDCCMMVLCDRIYANDHVIRDYQEFKNL